MKKRISKIKTMQTIKLLTFIVVGHGLVCITTSYVLAWLGKSNVLETLSGVLASEVIAPIVIYGVTKTIENIFEKNKLSFSEPIKENSEKVEG